MWYSQNKHGGSLARVLLMSTTAKYMVESHLGQGTFGCVSKCTRVEDGKSVAIKMMKNEGYLIHQTNVEVAALKRLRLLDPDKCNIVRFYEDFKHHGHNCLVFESLDKSLYDFMVSRKFQPLLLHEIRPIVKQIGNALHHLRMIGMVHADLKPENIMLVNHKEEPFKVKLIDFGLAHPLSSIKAGAYIQTRYFRSPEVLLGMPFTDAIDMWSLGCIMAFLYLGCLLYPGKSEYDMIRYIVETQGQPPDHLLACGTKTSTYFQKKDFINQWTSCWNLKAPEQVHQELGVNSVETRKMKLSALDDILGIQRVNPDNSADKVASMTDLLAFVDMLHEMLQLDHTRRIKPNHLLRNPFITMAKIGSMYEISSYVKACYKIMDVKPQPQTSDNGKAGESLLQPSSKTLSSDPSSSKGRQAKKDVSAGKKKKMAQKQTSEHLENSSDVKRVQKSPATSTASISSSSRAQTCTTTASKRMRSEDEKSGHDRKRVKEDIAGRPSCYPAKKLPSQPSDHPHHSSRPATGSSSDHARPASPSSTLHSVKRKSSDKGADGKDMSERKRKKVKKRRDDRTNPQPNPPDARPAECTSNGSCPANGSGNHPIKAVVPPSSTKKVCAEASDCDKRSRSEDKRASKNTNARPSISNNTSSSRSSPPKNPPVQPSGLGQHSSHPANEKTGQHTKPVKKKKSSASLNTNNGKIDDQDSVGKETSGQKRKRVKGGVKKDKDKPSSSTRRRNPAKNPPPPSELFLLSRPAAPSSTLPSSKRKRCDEGTDCKETSDHKRKKEEEEKESNVGRPSCSSGTQSKAKAASLHTAQTSSSHVAQPVALSSEACDDVWKDISRLESERELGHVETLTGSSSSSSSSSSSCSCSTRSNCSTCSTCSCTSCSLDRAFPVGTPPLEGSARTRGLPYQRAAVPEDHRTTGPEDHDTAGTEDQRTKEPEDHETAGTEDQRTTEPEDLRT